MLLGGKIFIFIYVYIFIYVDIYIYVYIQCLLINSVVKVMYSLIILQSRYSSLYLGY